MMCFVAAKRCPHYQLVNPGSATKCDCGYSFADGSVGAPLDLRKPGDSSEPTRSTSHSPNAHGPNAHSANLMMRVLIALLVAGAIIAIRVMIRR